jgi:hypothetical protein
VATTDSTTRIVIGLALAGDARLAIYLRVSAPINRWLRAAVTGADPPNEIRELQNRRDVVITARAELQTPALSVEGVEAGMSPPRLTRAGQRDGTLEISASRNALRPSSCDAGGDALSDRR